MAVKVIKTEGIQMDDGVYDAVLDDINQMPPTEAGKKPYYRWEFRVEHADYPDGARLNGYSSMSFAAKSKGLGWFQAVLARKLEMGEEIDTSSVLPARCRVVTKNNEDTGFVVITDVLKAPVNSTKSAPPQAADNGHDDVPA